ncbi:hypothetical protein [Rhizobium leguminosarum]|uniref:hypothetical protein n=1 Tax=Rhizobium leguminosarum TaxID=384 RepID=UPI001C93B61C|nr:hypothetical protein [Rhizobium leguminosarum]MBY5462083.1 hypothetical protein [Rhizobium leguminosarum]
MAVVAVLFFFMSGKKPASSAAALPPSGQLSTEDSRRKLEAEFARNKMRFHAMPDKEARELMNALRTDAGTHWDHAFNTSSADAKGAQFATRLALFRTAAVVLTGEQQPDESFFGGLELETVPFKELPPEQARAAFFEYCVAKYGPSYADWNVLNPALLKFADKVFEDSKAQSNPDGYVYEMIYRETLDWQKFLAEALSNRSKANA